MPLYAVVTILYPFPSALAHATHSLLHDYISPLVAPSFGLLLLHDIHHSIFLSSLGCCHSLFDNFDPDIANPSVCRWLATLTIYRTKPDSVSKPLA